MFLPAMPAAVLLQEQHVGAAALRAGNATGPAPRDQVFAAIDRVGEKDDGLLQCCRLDGFHTANLAGLLYFVKYISALIEVQKSVFHPGWHGMGSDRVSPVPATSRPVAWTQCCCELLLIGSRE